MKALLQRPHHEQCVTNADIIAMAKGSLFEMQGDRGGLSKAIGRAIAQMAPALALKKIRGGRGKETLWAPAAYVPPSAVAAAGAEQHAEAGSLQGAMLSQAVRQVRLVVSHAAHHGWHADPAPLVRAAHEFLAFLAAATASPPPQPQPQPSRRRSRLGSRRSSSRRSRRSRR
ncbi:MAG: hypothetical protein ABGW95_03610, partial [Candidatus Poseidoniia archaeon]